MTRSLLSFYCLLAYLALPAAVSATNVVESKQNTIERVRQEMAQLTKANLTSAIKTAPTPLMPDDQGYFTDLRTEEEIFKKKGYAASMNFNNHTNITNLGVKAWARLELLAAHLCHSPNLTMANDTVQRLLKAIAHYGDLEYNRNPLASGRFHGSCFAIPRHAANIYFGLLELMEKANNTADPSLSIAHDYLQKVAFQSWTQPLRNDLSDHNVVNTERFRGHVWWVGGNALRYRPVLESALMQRSVQMIDVLIETSVRSLSSVSQSTYDSAFWIEGMTADGSGWGHGMQNLVWGYPIDGVIGAFDILRPMKKSAWHVSLSTKELDVLMNYIRGSSFFHFKGVNPPIVDRYNMAYRNNVKSVVPSVRIASMLLNDWDESLTSELKNELKTFIAEAKKHDIRMDNYPRGMYNGARYFYNNDALVSKDSVSYVLINMGSKRVDGLESAFPGSSGFNLYAADGVTLFQTNGHEYRNIMGAMNLNGWPGTTTRQTTTTLRPIVNWRGYTSAYNYAAGATCPNGDFSAGFIHLKIDATNKAAAPDTIGNKDPNPTIFGVKAYKSYFMFGNQMLALGAGICNQQPEKEGDICTTIEQTHAPSLLTSKQTTLNGMKKMSKNEPQSITNEGYTYTVLPRYTSGQVEYSRSIRPTSWNKLGADNKVNENEVPVFEMRINHGRAIKNGSYAYVVQMPHNKETRVPRVLANNTALQAAESPSGNAFGAVVYDANHPIRTSLGEFRVSAPVALFITQVGTSIEIAVADAQMDNELNELHITTSCPLQGKGVRMTARNRYEITIELPREPHRGAVSRSHWSMKHRQ